MEKIINSVKKTYEENIRSIIIAFLISTFVSYVFWGNAVANPDTLIRGIPHGLQTWDIQIGRYGLYFFYFLNHGFSSSYFSTFIAIILFLFSGVCVIKLFNVENELIKIVIMVLMSCSTYSVGVITYPFCADANATGVLLAVSAIFILEYFNYSNKGIFIGALCLAFSISIYQSNIGITAITGVVVLIRGIFNNSKFFEKILRFAILMLLGSIFYYIGLRISLLVYGLELANYRGADKFGLINIIKNSPESIVKCYWDFFSFYFTRSYRMSNSFGLSIAYIFLGVLCALSIIASVIKRKLSKIQVILIIILLMISPIACNLINIVIPGTKIEILLTFPMISFPVLLFALCYNLLKNIEVYYGNIIKRALCIVMCSIAIIYMLINNLDGIEYKRHEDQVLYLANRIYTKLEDNGAIADSNIKVGIFGNPTDGNYKWQDKMSSYINDYATIGFFWGGYNFSFLGWKGVFTMYLGDTSIQWCSPEEEDIILKSEEFKNAPIYPTEGSIFKIGDVLVVKFANYQEN